MRVVFTEWESIFALFAWHIQPQSYIMSAIWPKVFTKSFGRVEKNAYFCAINRKKTAKMAMKASEQTLQQIERALRKVAEKFPDDKEASMLTDIHIRVTQETGELMVFDDDDRELTRCVVEQWIDNKDDGFYDHVAATLRRCISRQKKLMENLSVLKPYAFVLEDDDKEMKAELFVVDDEETAIIDSELMKDLDKDLDSFFDKLLKS